MNVNTLHELKIESKYFQDIKKGLKTFEIRYNDRNFKKNDKLLLREIDNKNNYTGNEILCDVPYILYNPFFVRKFVVMSIKVIFIIKRSVKNVKTN